MLDFHRELYYCYYFWKGGGGVHFFFSFKKLKQVFYYKTFTQDWACQDPLQVYFVVEIQAAILAWWPICWKPSGGHNFAISNQI